MDSAPLLSKSPEEVVLRALKLGLSVKLDDREVLMDEGGNLCTPVSRFRLFGAEPEVVHVLLDMPFGGFVRECRALSASYLLELQADIGLNEIKLHAKRY